MALRLLGANHGPDPPKNYTLKTFSLRWLFIVINSDFICMYGTLIYITLAARNIVYESILWLTLNDVFCAVLTRGPIWFGD